MRAIQSTEDFKRFLTLAGKFWAYSWRNWMLIAQQCPEATHVAGYRTWVKLKRQVRKGEKSIKILAPLIFKKEQEDGTKEPVLGGFRVVSIFDIAQTDGDDLPTGPSVRMLEGEEGAELYGRLSKLTDKHFALVDDKAIERGAAGYWQPATKEIHINSTLLQLQRVKTLAHELGHALAGHGCEGNKTTADEAETIAESVAFLVCDAAGLDTSERSFPYVARFARDMKVFARVLGEIQRIVKLILTQCDEANS